MSSTSSTVVVTGATGYLAGAIIDLFIKHGYSVRGTVRSITDSKAVQLQRDFPALRLFEADLLKEGSFTEAFSGADVVLHVASPTVLAPKDAEAEVIQPAVKGTANVVSTALATPSVKRIVVTSSTSTFLDGSQPDGTTYTEKDWWQSDMSNPYAHSKVLAEKKAWELTDSHNKANSGHKVKLIAILPSAVFGPPRGSRVDGFSVENLVMLLDGSRVQEGALPWQFPDVDIRNVAEAHLAAVRVEGASGRYIVSRPTSTTALEHIAILRRLYPTRTLPSKVAGDFWYKQHSVDNSRSINELGITYLPRETTLKDSVDKLVQMKMVAA